MTQEPTWIAEVQVMASSLSGSADRCRVTQITLGDARAALKAATAAKEGFSSEFDTYLERISAARTLEERRAAYNNAQQFQTQRGAELETAFSRAQRVAEDAEVQERRARQELVQVIKSLREDLDAIDLDAIEYYPPDEEDDDSNSSSSGSGGGNVPPVPAPIVPHLPPGSTSAAAEVPRSDGDTDDDDSIVGRPECPRVAV